MIITGPEGYLPVQKKTARRVSPAGVNRPQSPEGCFDNYTASAAAEQDGRSFREAVANLSYQVRTHNTTGKIQELRGAVRSGEYQLSPRDTAARMLLLSEEAE